MSKIVKATQAEKEIYNLTKPIYPLYGFIILDGHQCPIEDLRGSWSKPDPIYEVMAPKGFHFDVEQVHTLLCCDLAEIKMRCGMNNLEPCTEVCA